MDKGISEYRRRLQIRVDDVWFSFHTVTTVNVIVVMSICASRCEFVAFH